MHFSSFLTDQTHRLPTIKIPTHWRVLITGVTSIHGWPIYKRLNELIPQNQLLAIRPNKMSIPNEKNVQAKNISDKQDLLEIKKTFNPTHIIHGAGVCDLDACEARPDWATEINLGGAQTIMDVFEDAAYIMYLSSDLVYSGNNPPAQGYHEGHDTDPVSVVAKTFLAAEQVIANHPNHSIIRLALPIGDSITGTKGAVDFIEKRFKRNLPMTLFYDEIRSCVCCLELTEMIMHLFSQQAEGLFHLGGQAGISLYTLGEKIINKGNYPKHLLHRLSRYQEKNGPPRIGNVALDSSKLETWFKQNVLCTAG